jgi:FSR family fosmidomycin resistance protein-like MFS transporter
VGAAWHAFSTGLTVTTSTSDAGVAVSPIPQVAVGAKRSRHTFYGVLAGVSSAHFLNDMMQQVIVTIYPLLQGEFHLTLGQIGLIQAVFQVTAALLQPLVGLVTDKYPLPYATPFGMAFTLAGLLLMAVAPSYPILLVAVALIGFGSSVFHPQSSQAARAASGGKYGLAQSLFQIGGQFGQALGPFLVGAFIVSDGVQGRIRVGWFGVAALAAIVILLQVSRWYAHHLDLRKPKRKPGAAPRYPAPLVRRTVGLLFVLIFSKFWYLASISVLYQFFLIQRFGVNKRVAAYLFGVFTVAMAIGTLVGGPLGDRIGRRRVIWFSILGCAPFTLALPYVGLDTTIVLSAVIGLVLSSAFPAIIVYAQDMVPQRVGMVSGLFYGFSFGLGGLGGAVLSALAEYTSVDFVYKICALLPLLGLLAAFLPDVRPLESEVVAHAEMDVDAHELR